MATFCLRSVSVRAALTFIALIVLLLCPSLFRNAGSSQSIYFIY